MTYRFLPTATLLLLAACTNYPEIEDSANVCVYAEGQDRLVAYAQINNCAGDHKGAYLKCTITVDGQNALIETVFKDGKDPNHGCVGPIEGTCEAVVPPGDYTLEFDGDERMIVVPGGTHVCFGADPSTGTDGG